MRAMSAANSTPSDVASRSEHATLRPSGVMRRWVSRLVWPDAHRFRSASTVVLHEWLAVTGGSDKVADRLARLVDADVVFTFALDDECVADIGFDRPVVTWRFGRWAGRSRRFTYLLPVMPVVWWALDVPAARTVITSSHACVNAARRTGARRLSYCHTPMRYAWEWRLEQERAPRALRPVLAPFAAILRRLDRRWSRNVDVYLANSATIAERIGHAYRRSAEVVPPPIDVDRFPLRSTPRTLDDPFVAAGRFVPYKRFDLAVRAANRAGVALVLAGDGPDAARLESLAGPTVTIVRGPDDAGLAHLLAAARAFVFPGVEDFGMLAVEAQACGTPVIARRAGGALDNVSDGTTGTFVDDDTVAAWADAFAAFDPAAYDPVEIRSWATRFGVDAFDRNVRGALDRMDGAA